ncbi:MAG: hypothetical protein Q9162_001541 [Coniocarpon cinnabarinum]
MHDYAVKAAHEHDAIQKDREDEYNAPLSLVKTILSSNLPAEEKSVTRLTHESFEIFAAGGATTARMMNYAVYYILSNPSSKEKVLTEIEQVMPDPGTIPSLTTLEALPYLTMVIREVLRVTALMTVSVARVADEPLFYGEQMIPAGTTVGLSLSDILRDEDVFPNAREFWPERWVAADTEHRKLMDECFVPFGRGTRACLGMKYVSTNPDQE